MARKKSIYQYSVVFEPNEQGGYNVTVPALPGCVTFGQDFEHACAMAREVIELWLQELADQGQPLPYESSRAIISMVEASVPQSARRKVYATA